MSTRAGLIAAILDNLADDTPRLIFADFLQENGEPERADFIRLQIEAARSPITAHLKKKIAKLAEKHWQKWHGVFGLANYQRMYRRGFFDRIALDTIEFADKAASILATEPATFSLVLHPHADTNETPVTAAHVGKVGRNPHLKAVVAIHSHVSGWGPKNFSRLMQSPHLGNLKRIEVFEDVVGLAGVKAIVESPSRFVLHHLGLNESLQNLFSQEKPNTRKAVKLLAASPRFASLKHLNLSFNELSNRSAEILLQSETLPRSMHLDIGDNPCEDDYSESLAERFTGDSDGVEDED